MSRDISPDVSLGDLTLRLDMTALYDFEQQAEITVSSFLAPIIGIVQDLDFGAMQDLPDDEKNSAGLDLINTILAGGTIAAKNLLILVWAMAGGEDLEESPREFGRRVNWQNRNEIAAAVLKSLKSSYPAKAVEVSEKSGAAEAAGDDPLASSPA